MLVLSRKKNESIVIGDEIEITVMEVRADRTRLGVVAPSNVPVYRREDWDALPSEPPGPGSGHRLVGPGLVSHGRMMLVSRKTNESIVINGDVIVTVVEIRGDKVRLGIESPKEVPPHRREIYDMLRRTDRGN